MSEFSCTKEERSTLDDIYERAPSLRKEGIVGWYGYFVHWDEVIAAISKAWPEEKHISYDRSPLELLYRLIDERDAFRKVPTVEPNEIARVRKQKNLLLQMVRALTARHRTGDQRIAEQGTPAYSDLLNIASAILLEVEDSA